MAVRLLFESSAGLAARVFRAKPGEESASAPHELNAEKREFRLLKLEDGKGTDPIRCQTATCSLSWRCPPFLALSYCWGDPLITESIIVNGESANVTVNLARALWQLREFRISSEKLLDCSLDSYLWIDALCINQTSIAEKNYMVPLMATIYSTAARVLIWLGPGNRGSDRFFDWIRTSWESPSSWGSWWGGDADRMHRVRCSSPSADMYWFSFSIVIGGWFSRIWPVQETTRAREDPIVICGSRVESFEHFASVLREMKRNSHETRATQPSAKVAPYLRELQSLQNPSELRQKTEMSFSRVFYITNMRPQPDVKHSNNLPSLEQALVGTRFHDATDKRDKAYGIIGIMDEHWGRKIPVDYGLSVEEISHQLTIKCFRRCSFLPLAIAQRHRAAWEPTCSRPSWSLDFEREAHPDYKHYSIGSTWQIPPRVKLSSNDRVLSIPATALDCVQSTQLLDFDPYSSPRKMQAIADAASAAERTTRGAPHPLASLQTNARYDLPKLMTLKTGLPVSDQHTSAESHLDAQAYWARLLQDDPSIKPAKPLGLNAISPWWWTQDAPLALFAANIQHRVQGLAFFTTAAGFIGIGPRALASGDELLLLHGADSIVAVRAVQDGKHRILGPTFILHLSDQREALYRLRSKGKIKDRTLNLA